MIRRDAGADWLLITQPDHAAVAARLAGHIGGRRFAPLIAQRESVLAAIATHDDGWRAHDDDAPTLDPLGRPLDVFESPRSVSLPAWSASTERATVAAGPYAGLLVSLHSLSLSIRAAGAAGPGHASIDLSNARAVFEVNQFQHREIERQGQLREAVGLPTDVPLQHGLAEPGASAGDDRLAYHFRLLQAMDLISLCACCTHPPADRTDDVFPAPGTRPWRLRVGRDNRGAVRVTPWPFDAAMIEVSVRCRRLPAKPFEDVTAFRAAYAAAAVETFPVVVRG
jgi:hypothetical protein